MISVLFFISDENVWGDTEFTDDFPAVRPQIAFTLPQRIYTTPRTVPFPAEEYIYLPPCPNGGIGPNCILPPVIKAVKSINDYTPPCANGGFGSNCVALPTPTEINNYFTPTFTTPSTIGGNVKEYIPPCTNGGTGPRCLIPTSATISSTTQNIINESIPACDNGPNCITNFQIPTPTEKKEFKPPGTSTPEYIPPCTNGGSGPNCILPLIEYFPPVSITTSKPLIIRGYVPPVKGSISEEKNSPSISSRSGTENIETSASIDSFKTVPRKSLLCTDNDATLCIIKRRRKKKVSNTFCEDGKTRGNCVSTETIENAFSLKTLDSSDDFKANIASLTLLAPKAENQDATVATFSTTEKIQAETLTGNDFPLPPSGPDSDIIMEDTTAQTTIYLTETTIGSSTENTIQSSSERVFENVPPPAKNTSTEHSAESTIDTVSVSATTQVSSSVNEISLTSTSAGSTESTTEDIFISSDIDNTTTNDAELSNTEIAELNTVQEAEELPTTIPSAIITITTTTPITTTPISLLDDFQQTTIGEQAEVLVTPKPKFNSSSNSSEIKSKITELKHTETITSNLDNTFEQKPSVIIQPPLLPTLSPLEGPAVPPFPPPVVTYAEWSLLVPINLRK